ncbi:MAG: hypothetical protein M3250_00605 [Thermoproteota archaeon]|nr:hypothetical protein [Thermoproteota archaeon]
MSDGTLTDNDRKRLIIDWLWEIGQELAEINSTSLSTESKDKIKALLSQVEDIVVVEEEKKIEVDENI